MVRAIISTQPQMVAMAGAPVRAKPPSALKKLPEERLAKAPSMAPAEMMGTIFWRPRESRWLTLSILSVNRRVKTSQPREPQHMTHTPQEKARGLRLSRVVPMAWAPKPAAMAS